MRAGQETEPPARRFTDQSPEPDPFETPMGYLNEFLREYLDITVAYRQLDKGVLSMLGSGRRKGDNLLLSVSQDLPPALELYASLHAASHTLRHDTDLIQVIYEPLPGIHSPVRLGIGHMRNQRYALELSQAILRTPSSEELADLTQLLRDRGVCEETASREVKTLEELSDVLLSPSYLVFKPEVDSQIRRELRYLDQIAS